MQLSTKLPATNYYDEPERPLRADLAPLAATAVATTVALPLFLAALDTINTMVGAA